MSILLFTTLDCFQPLARLSDNFYSKPVKEYVMLARRSTIGMAPNFCRPPPLAAGRGRRPSAFLAIQAFTYYPLAVRASSAMKLSLFLGVRIVRIARGVLARVGMGRPLASRLASALFF